MVPDYFLQKRFPLGLVYFVYRPGNSHRLGQFLTRSRQGSHVFRKTATAVTYPREQKRVAQSRVRAHSLPNVLNIRSALLTQQGNFIYE